MTESDPDDPVGIGPGERSARRILVIDSALLVLIVAAVHVAFVAQGGLREFPAWSLALGWVSAGLTVLAGLLARRVPDAALRILALAAVAGYWATIVTFPAAVPAEGIDRIPWTLSASGAAAAAALVAGGRGLAWATVVVGATAGLVFRALYGGLDLDGVVNDLQALLTGAVICVIGGHILAVGRGLDRAAAATAAAAAQESAERGRLAARSRAAALVHDEVLATLSLAASGLPVPRGRLAAQARDAASMVTRLADEQADEPVLLRDALAEEARRHGASFTELPVQADTVAQAVAGPQAVDALLGASRQALRNSVRHAPGAVRSVLLVHAAGELRVEIVDDGPGFEPGQVADDRLGIRQSIVGRMNRLDGGSAEIDSAPGRGTVVRLRIAATTGRTSPAPGDRASLRVGVVVIAVAYVATQALCALLASVAAPESWPLQLSMLVTALVAAEVLRRSPQRMPGRIRTALVVVLACGGLAVGSAVAHFWFALEYSYGTMWFAVAFAFLFVALALRRRIVASLIGAGVIVLVLVGAGMLAGASAGQTAQVSVRPVVIVTLAVALLIVVERMQQRIAVLHRESVDFAERESWTRAGRAELTGRLAELVRTAVPLLERIGLGEEASETQRLEYASCEGELRDGLRAGSLARGPLISVVASARERGVDVLLLDDCGGAVDDLEPVLEWMAAAIATARIRAVGRLLPAGRGARASLTVDGVHSEFAAPAAASAQGSVMSFHGE